MTERFKEKRVGKTGGEMELGAHNDPRGIAEGFGKILAGMDTEVISKPEDDQEITDELDIKIVDGKIVVEPTSEEGQN
jgi:hypothetical protein